MLTYLGGRKTKLSQITLLLAVILGFASYSYAQEKPEVSLGGALRFNYRLQPWNDQQELRGGDIGFDMLAINPKASYKGLTLQIKYRLFAANYGPGLLRQGDITYNFENQQDKFVIGLTKVPFGIEPYNSHSYFLGMGYYMGYEDDYDVGFKFAHEGEAIDYQLAFFKNAEDLFSGTDVSQRYSYDVVGDYRETNQLNAKFVFKSGPESKQRIGTSLMYGGLHNIKTNGYYGHYAAALHYENTIGEFNAKLQGMYFKKEVASGTDVVELGAYRLEYNIATEGALYTAGFSYNFPVESDVFDNLQLYDNFAYFDKAKTDFQDSFSNTIGLLIHAGNLYTYAEFITAQNQPWFTEGWTHSFGQGDKKTQFMVNVNIGYYF